MGKRLLYQASFLKCRQCFCLGVLRKHVFTGRVTPSGCAILDAPSPAHSAHLDGCSGLPLVHDTFLDECPAQKSRETNTWETPLTSGKYGAHRSMPLSSSRSTWDISREVKVELIYIAHSGDPDNSCLGWPSFWGLHPKLSACTHVL